ncbi:hypothetical protein MMC29_005423, partial [Sticta canariensis]|nr:hypothetical protein [Sticta canariensis]
MKALSIYAVLVALALKQATAAALPEPESPVIQNTKFGPGCSDVASNQRCGNEDFTYHPVEKDILGTVDSNVAPSTSKCSDAKTFFELTRATTNMGKKHDFLGIKLVSVPADHVLSVAWAKSTKSTMVRRSRNEIGALA